MVSSNREGSPSGSGTYITVVSLKMNATYNYYFRMNDVAAVFMWIEVDSSKCIGLPL